MTLGQLIRTYREAAAMSLDEVAKHVDMSKSNLSRIERDLLEPGVRACLKLALLLGIPLGRIWVVIM